MPVPDKPRRRRKFGRMIEVRDPETGRFVGTVSKAQHRIFGSRRKRKDGDTHTVEAL